MVTRHTSSNPSNFPTAAWSKWKTPGLPNSDPQLAEGDMDLCPIEDGEDVEEDDTFAAKDVGDTYLDIIEPLSPDDVSSDGRKDIAFSLSHLNVFICSCAHRLIMNLVA